MGFLDPVRKLIAFMDLHAKPFVAPQSDSAESTGTTPAPFKWTPRNAVIITLIVLCITAAFVLAWRFQGVLFSFIVALMLHIAVKPSVDRLRQRGMRLELGMILVYVVVFALVFSFIALLAPFIVNQVTTIFTRLPVYYGQVREALLQSGGMLQSLAQSLPPDITAMLLPAPTPANEPMPGVSPFDVVNALLYGLAAFIGIFLMAYYWAIEGERITYSLLLRAPAEKRDGIRELIAEMESKVGAFYRGQLILCAFVGGLQLIAYLVIGLPYAVILALLAFIGEAIPLIGPALGAIPAIIVALAIAPDKAIWVIVSTLIIQQIENNILVPRVMDRAVGVNPIVSILSIIAFGALFGLVGALLAIPIAAIVQILLNRALFATQPANVEVPIASGSDLTADMQSTTFGRDRTSVLRLEAREIAEDVRKQLRAGSAADEAVAEVDPDEQQVEDMIEAIALDLDTLLAETQASSTTQPAQPMKPEMVK
jgi:predicted PurR-regulated permease PerM